MQTPAIYICVRRTLDWQDEALVRSKIRRGFRAKLEAWNATFDPPYHRFRQRLAEIARSSHARVEDAACVPLDRAPLGALVVPVDDDDWFAPDLAHRLRARHEESLHGYHWRREVIEPLERRRGWLGIERSRKRRNQSFTCATNNYALRNLPELAGLALRHKRASEYFDAHPSRVRRIPGTLGIQNRSLASRTALAWKRPTISRDELVASFHRYRDLYTPGLLTRELRWARPYVERMAELMAEIRFR